MTSNNSLKELEEQIYQTREELLSLFNSNRMDEYEKARSEKLNPLLKKYKSLTGKTFIPNSNKKQEESREENIVQEEKDKTPDKEKIIPKRKKKIKNNIVGAPAPKLDWVGDKWNGQGTYDRENRPHGYYFYQLPVLIMDYICETLDGKNGTMLKIMMVLIGTDRDFGVSEKWMCDRIGVKNRDSAKSYYRARNELHRMGWIEYDWDSHKIYLCYDFLWQEALAEKEDRFPVLEWRKDESRG